MSTSPDPNLSVDPVRSFAAVDSSATAESGWERGLASQQRSRGQQLVDFLMGRNNTEAVARHRLEYSEPSIWLWRRIVGASFAFIIVTMTWYLIKVPSGLISDDALPTQTQVATAFNEVRSDGFAGATLGGHLGRSLFRLAFGLGIGSLVGVSLGIVVGAAPLARTVIDPISSFFRMVPGLVVAPLFLVWAGVGELTIIGVVAFSVMWPVMGAASEARIRSQRGEPLNLLRDVVAGMRSALLMGWVTVLAIETVLASTGIGSMVWFAQSRSDMIVVGIYIAGLMGFVFDSLLRTIEYFLTEDTRDRVSEVPSEQRL